jgi:hypothetical protein
VSGPQPPLLIWTGGAELALRAANAAAVLVEQIKRATPKPLESIAAQSGLAIDTGDFRGWHRVSDSLRNVKAHDYLPPNEEDIERAYQPTRRGWSASSEQDQSECRNAADG